MALKIEAIELAEELTEEYKTTVYVNLDEDIVDCAFYRDETEEETQQEIETTEEKTKAERLKDFKRVKMFLVELDNYIGEHSYYDDEIGDVVTDSDEEECYDYLMCTREFHWLGEKVVKSVIEMAFNDWENFCKLKHSYDAFV